MNEENRIALLRKTGSLIESPSGYLHLTARENLKIIADLKDIDHKDIDRVLEIVHLTARRKPQSRAVLSWHETETWHCNGITWQSQAADPG